MSLNHKIQALLLLLVLSSCKINAQDSDELKNLEQHLDSLIQSNMTSQHIPGASFIIVKDNNILLKKGYGFNTLGEGMNYINPDSTIFRIGSVTKTFTATALLQLVDRNVLGLNSDVNNYLKNIKVPIAYNNPITPHHILTHSTGLDELKGRRVFQENQQIPLKEFLNDRLVRIRKPGVVSAYSTYGIALGGLLIEDITGLTYETYLKENIWKPLNMTMTSVNVPEHQNRHISLGYEIYNGVNIPQPWEWYHTFPASSINSTVSDMGKYMLMHLNKGKLNTKQILSRYSSEKMQSQQLSVDKEVNGFAYGFYEKERKGFATYGHGGEMLGYSSDLVLVPELNMGIFVVHHHEGTNLRRLIIDEVLEHYKKETEKETIRKEIKIDLIQFVGSYRWMSDCYTCKDEIKTWELTLDKEYRLQGFGRTFVQVQPLVFKSTDGERTMGFKMDDNGMIKYMSLGNINAFEKVYD